MSDQTGFREVPWDFASAGVESMDELPPAPARVRDAVCCISEWRGSFGDDEAWACTLPQGHPGTHRAGNGLDTVAEWRDEDAEVAR